MASYQARQRDPLLDSDTQAILERRGKELLGVGLAARRGRRRDDPWFLLARGSKLDVGHRRTGAQPLGPLRRFDRVAALYHFGRRILGHLPPC